MARRDRNSTPTAEAVTDESTEAVTDSSTEEPTATSTDESPATDAPTEKPAKSADPTDEEIAAAVNPFLAVVAEVVELRDTETGVLPQEAFDKVNAAYSAIDGVKLKNRAKDAMAPLMREAMGSLNAQLARAYMDLTNNLTAAKKSSGGGSKPKAPVDPTEAFVERVAVLRLASTLAEIDVPEKVAEDWDDKVAARLDAVSDEQIDAYRTWLASEAEDKGDAPEGDSIIAAAVKLSQGKSARPGRASKAGAVSSGVRHSVAKHIQQAFEDKPSGTWLSIAEIGNFKSAEYGDDPVSQGAISSRLFPSTGKCTVEGVTPQSNDKGNKGAVKN